MKPIIALLPILVCLTVTAQAQTIVPGGNVSGNWNALGSPYLVQGNITVPAGDSLAIGPGVEVVFQGHYYFSVQGKLNALGTATDSIRFTAADTVIGWSGLSFYGNTIGSSQLEYCEVSYSKVTSESGGGISVGSSSTIILSNCTISQNSTNFNGGGINTSGYLTINSCLITQNYAGGNGGGIYISYHTPTMIGSTISFNSATNGGGISFTGDTHLNIGAPLPNIFANQAPYGSDLYSNWVQQPISITVDTFTVLHPSAYYASPLSNFNFSVAHGFQTQVNADLYISPEGSNSNSGLSWAEPLRSINYALSIIDVGPSHPHVIHLADGVYSASINQEIFPVPMTSYVSLLGSSQAGTILDGEGQFQIILCNGISPSAIRFLTLRNGHGDPGGAVSSLNSNTTFNYCTFDNNSTAGAGGGLNSYLSTIDLGHSTFTGNSAGDGGGGLASTSSNLSAEYCAFTNNSASMGGGAHLIAGDSPLIINQSTFTDNSASFGGGMDLSALNNGSTISLTNCTVIGNYSANYGGGIFFSTNPGLIENVTITDNSAGQTGGGISSQTSLNHFSATNRCNIYSNHAPLGADVSVWNYSPPAIVNVIVDTFTVASPTSYYATPLNHFTFDIWHAVIAQADTDLYVSPTGSNANTGYSWAEPLRNVGYALSIIRPDSVNPHTIHLASGIYSPTSNQEIFPLIAVSHTNISGVGESLSVLDADTTDRVMSLIGVHNSIIEKLTIKRGKAYDGGGVHCEGSSAILDHCIISHSQTISTSNDGGGGIYCVGDSSIFSYCVITENITADQGGGIFIWSGHPSLHNCTITGNSAQYGGGGAFVASTPSIIQNCTFYGNTSPDGSGIKLYSASATLKNTIVSSCTGSAAVNFSSSTNANVKYCDFANNPSGNFSGTPPSGLGIVYQLNANGDSCDNHYNIFEDPLFVDPDSGDFHLQAGSPCIDAGDPASPYDPDFTVADIGAFYFNQATPVIVGLLPHNPPIVIPVQGGSFQFDCQIHNNDTVAHVGDLYLSVTLPGGGNYPITTRSNIRLPVGASIIHNNLTQVVPGSAAPGNYVYKATLREHSTWVLLDEDSFPFQKAFGEALAGRDNEWPFLGWDEPQALALPDHFSLETPSPNPFNPTTALSYKLQASSHVSLKVYDTSGRLVTTLVDGWREAGTHEITFDGGALASGLYFARMQAGEFTAIQKMMLIK